MNPANQYNLPQKQCVQQIIHQSSQPSEYFTRRKTTISTIPTAHTSNLLTNAFNRHQPHQRQVQVNNANNVLTKKYSLGKVKRTNSVGNIHLQNRVVTSYGSVNQNFVSNYNSNGQQLSVQQSSQAPQRVQQVVSARKYDSNIDPGHRFSFDPRYSNRKLQTLVQQSSQHRTSLPAMQLFNPSISSQNKLNFHQNSQNQSTGSLRSLQGAHAHQFRATTQSFNRQGQGSVLSHGSVLSNSRKPKKRSPLQTRYKEHSKAYLSNLRKNLTDTNVMPENKPGRNRQQSVQSVSSKDRFMINPNVFNQKPVQKIDFKASFNQLKENFRSKNLTQNLEDSPPAKRNRTKHFQSLQQDNLHTQSIQNMRSLAQSASNINLLSRKVVKLSSQDKRDIKGRSSSQPKNPDFLKKFKGLRSKKKAKKLANLSSQQVDEPNKSSVSHSPSMGSGKGFNSDTENQRSPASQARSLKAQILDAQMSPDQIKIRKQQEVNKLSEIKEVPTSVEGLQKSGFQNSQEHGEFRHSSPSYSRDLLNKKTELQRRVSKMSDNVQQRCSNTRSSRNPSNNFSKNNNLELEAELRRRVDSFSTKRNEKLNSIHPNDTTVENIDIDHQFDHKSGHNNNDVVSMGSLKSPQDNFRADVTNGDSNQKKTVSSHQQHRSEQSSSLQFISHSKHENENPSPMQIGEAQQQMKKKNGQNKPIVVQVEKLDLNDFEDLDDIGDMKSIKSQKQKQYFPQSGVLGTDYDESEMPMSSGTPERYPLTGHRSSPPQTKSKKDREVIPKPGISLSKRKKKNYHKKKGIFSPHRPSLDPNSTVMNPFQMEELSPGKKELLRQMQKLNEQIEREIKITKNLSQKIAFVNSDFATEEESRVHKKMVEINGTKKNKLPPHLAALPKYVSSLRERKANLAAQFMPLGNQLENLSYKIQTLSNSKQNKEQNLTLLLSKENLYFQYDHEIVDILSQIQSLKARVDRENVQLEKEKYNIVSKTEEKIRRRCERKAEDLGRKWGIIWAKRENMGMMNMSGEDDTDSFDQLGKMAEWLEEKLEEKRQQILNNQNIQGDSIWGYTGQNEYSEQKKNTERAKIRLMNARAEANSNSPHGKRRLSPRQPIW